MEGICSFVLYVTITQLRKKKKDMKFSSTGCE